MTIFCFVIDCNGKQLAPTSVNKGWFLIRKQRAKLISKYPMIIQLHKEVFDNDKDTSEFVVGIDDGSKHVGIAVVQKGLNTIKTVFKGTIELRQDVSKKITERSRNRYYRRFHKRYRPARFSNRASSKCLGRLAPSIKQKKDSILRVVNFLGKYLHINKIVLEDVLIDSRKLQQPNIVGLDYQKTNRLEENLRSATLMRDGFSCRECGVKNTRLEAHHILPKRNGGNDSIFNLITLCSDCHKKVTGNEEQSLSKFQKMIGGKNFDYASAQHVMIGKTYLRKYLGTVSQLELVYGYETNTRRITLGIEKSHSNDAVLVTGICSFVDTQEYKIFPLRKRTKAITKELNGFKHRDYVRYTKKNGTIYEGFITAFLIKRNAYRIRTIDGRKLDGYGFKRLELLSRFRGLQCVAV